MKREPLILIDAGHGHLINGVYQTPGKRFVNGRISLYEGVLNKAVAYNLALRLSLDDIPCEVINPENHDLSLDTRAKRANQRYEDHNCIYLSIHHNAFNDATANGCEVFTSYGETLSDSLSEILGSMFLTQFPHRHFRRDTVRGRLGKEAGFKVLKKTKCPAILIEFGFMTGSIDRPYITSDDGIRDQVTWIKMFIDYCIQTQIL